MFLLHPLSTRITFSSAWISLNLEPSGVNRAGRNAEAAAEALHSPPPAAVPAPGLPPPTGASAHGASTASGPATLSPPTPSHWTSNDGPGPGAGPPRLDCSSRTEASAYHPATRPGPPAHGPGSASEDPHDARLGAAATPATGPRSSNSAYASNHRPQSATGAAAPRPRPRAGPATAAVRPVPSAPQSPVFPSCPWTRPLTYAPAGGPSSSSSSADSSPCPSALPRPRP